MAEAVDTAIYTRLAAVSGVTDLVSTRIYSVKKDGDKPAAFPYITWERVSNIANHHTMSLPQAFPVQAQYRFNVWAKTTATSAGHTQAAEITKQVRNALHGFDNATILSAICDDYYPISAMEPDVHHWVCDFVIAHNADTS